MYKERLREIIFGYKTKAGKRFDIVLLAAIIISVIGVMLDSDKKIHEKYGSLLLAIEWGFTIFFTWLCFKLNSAKWPGNIVWSSSISFGESSSVASLVTMLVATVGCVLPIFLMVLLNITSDLPSAINFKASTDSPGVWS